MKRKIVDNWRRRRKRICQKKKKKFSFYKCCYCNHFVLFIMIMFSCIMCLWVLYVPLLTRKCTKVFLPKKTLSSAENLVPISSSLSRRRKKITGYCLLLKMISFCVVSVVSQRQAKRKIWFSATFDELNRRMCLIWVCQHNSAWKPCTNVLQIIRWKKNGHFCGQKCEIAWLATVIDLKISMKQRQSALLLYQMCFVPKMYVN